MELQDFIQSVDFAYIASFALFFALIFFAMKKSVFRKSGDNKIAVIIAASLSALVVWGLGNQTNLLDGFFLVIGDLTYNLQSVESLFAAAIFGLIILGLFYKGLKNERSKWVYNHIYTAFGVLGILLFFADQIFSSYFLPYWVYQWQWFFLIAGIGMIVLTIWKREKVDVGDRPHIVQAQSR